MNYSIVLPALTGMAGNATRKNRRKNPKRTGELSEAAFVLKAQSLGFLVSKPWGDSEKYDFIVDSGGDSRGDSGGDSGSRLWRVQLKATEVVHARGYEVQPIYSVYSGTYGRGKAAYTAEEIDALVVHIPPRNAWYVLPVEAFAPAKNLRFYPDIECKCARWERYREAWELLRTRQTAGEARPV